MEASGTWTVNPKNGKLFVNERIDRDALCDASSCVLNLEARLENPSEAHSVEVEVVDANDNAPQFPRDEYQLEISESEITGSALSHRVRAGSGRWHQFSPALPAQSRTSISRSTPTSRRLTASTSNSCSKSRWIASKRRIIS
ncbi:hypothetical protein AOLI_G00231550 [Acnodon oligacanthus]